MKNSTGDRNPVERLAEEFAARYRRGETPTLTEYTDRYPQWAGEIRELFPALLLMEQLKPRREGSAPSVPSPTPPVRRPVPARLGDFRILGFVAGGGMGDVYEAEQQSMGRHVALKILKPEILTEKALKRFRRESRAAGRLHHTNIVPVFGVGESDGFHYYAMQFIPGEPLSKVITDLRCLRDAENREASPPAPPTGTLSAALSRNLLIDQFPDAAPNDDGSATIDAPPDALSDWPSGAEAEPDRESTNGTLSVAGSSAGRSGLSGPSCRPYFKSVARIGKQVAEALHYAHRHGILHRDVKPSNLLLDALATVWVADFGLAREEGDEDLSRGDIPGTLRFMAPERFDRASLPQSDVYALGLTLYELTTLEPAFRDESPARLIRRIQYEQPKLPREVDRSIPRDLETIILKAIEKDPARRYATADKLARDLGAFLENREIAARRDRWYEKIGRWCQRNPAVAGLSALALALLLAIAIVASVMSVRLGRALSASRKAETHLAQEIRKQKENLFHAELAEARARRYSRRLGQRFASLDALNKAVRLARELRLPPESLDDLRNEAIASLAVVDLRPHNYTTPLPADVLENGFHAYDSAFQIVASTIDREGTIKVRRNKDGQVLARLQGFPGMSEQIRFSPDGRYLAAWNSSRLRVWDLSHQAANLLIDQVAAYPYVGESVHRFDMFSPDSRRLIVYHHDGRLSVHDLPSCKVLRELAIGRSSPNFVFHPEGRRLAVSHGSQVQVWDLEAGAMVFSFPQPQPAVQLTWSPDGATFASASHSNVYLSYVDCDQKRYQPLHQLPHVGGGLLIGFDPSGEVLYSGSAWVYNLRFWHVRTGKLLLSHPDVLYPDFFKTSGRLTEWGGTPWEVATGREYRTLTSIHGEAGGYYFPAIAPEGRLMAVGREHGLGFWDLELGTEVGYLPLGHVRKPVFELSGALLVKIEAGLFRWSLQSRADGTIQIGPYTNLAFPHSGAELWAATSRDGGVIAQVNYHDALVLRDGLPLQTLGPLKDARILAISPDGRWVATLSHSTGDVDIWDLDGGTNAKISGPWNGLISFSPDGRWLASGGWLWNVGSWEKGPRIGDLVSSFSPRGDVLASHTKGTLRLIEVPTGRELARLEDPNQDDGYSVTFSPDGTRLITTNNDSGSIHIWDLRLIRRRLSEMGLDWDQPTYTEPEPDRGAEARPLRLHLEPREESLGPPSG